MRQAPGLEVGHGEARAALAGRDLAPLRAHHNPPTGFRLPIVGGEKHSARVLFKLFSLIQYTSVRVLESFRRYFSILRDVVRVNTLYYLRAFLIVSLRELRC